MCYLEDLGIFKQHFLLSNSFPNKPWFLLICSTSLLKTLWEKEKLLITSNFSFLLSVFNPFGELSAFHIKFKFVFCKLFQFGKWIDKVVAKGEILLTCIFSFLHKYFERFFKKDGKNLRLLGNKLTQCTIKSFNKLNGKGF